MKNNRIFAAAAAALVLLTACAEKDELPHLPSEGEIMVTFINVGKGDCILIEKDGTNLLIDTGYRETANLVLGTLRDKGINRLDAMIITHYDKDHVGGAGRIAGSITVDTLYLPDYEGDSRDYKELLNTVKVHEINTVSVTEDTALTLAGVDYELYASDVGYEKESGQEGNDNDMSLVVSAVYEEDSYLFTGDMLKEETNSWLTREAGSFDVMKMPHHGSRNGSSDELIDAVSPKIVVITDGVEKPADKKLLKLLDKADAEVYRTCTQGTIVIKSSGGGKYTVEHEKST